VYEYKIVPAPRKGLKAKGLKSSEDRFAHTLSELINEQARDGWEFQRAETLPSEERSGIRSTTIVYRSVLVFRKAPAEAEDVSGVSAPEAGRVPPIAPAAPQPVISEEDAPEPLDQDSSSAKA